MKNTKIIKWIAPLVVGGVLLTGCDNPFSDDEEVTTTSYNGPGSDYSLSLKSNNTFSLTEADSNLSLTGTYASLNSGFKKLTVSTTNDSSSVAVGSGAYILEIPGTVTLLKPIGSNTQIINMVVGGSCPSADFTANWVNTYKDLNITTGDVMGTFVYTHSTTSGTLPSKYTVSGSAVSDNNSNLGTLSCNDGIVSGSDFKMYLTSNGGAIVRTFGENGAAGGGDDQFIVGLSQDTITSLSELDGNYAGLVFEESSSGENIFAVSTTLSSGTGQAFPITDIDNNTLGSDGATISLGTINSPSNGFINGTITSDGSGTVQCMANTNINNSGKNFLFCVGQNPGENSKLYNLLLVSK